MLNTQRLFLRNLRKRDIPAIHAWRNDPVCFRFQRWEDTSEEAVAAYVGKYENSTFLSKEAEQHYAVCCDNGIVGDLSYFFTEEDRCVTLGITISPEQQRKGYAREILSAVVSAVQQKYPELEIVALIEKDNAPSIALFESLGFQRECYAEKIQSYVYVIYGKENTVFYPVDDLRDKEICLKLTRTAEAQPVKRWLPAYYFDICLKSGEKIGYCDLRIGHNEKTYIGGNIGYGIEEAYRGNNYAAKACALLFRQAKKHGMDHLFITCGTDNIASARTCELAGGIFAEIADVPEDNELYEDLQRVRVYRFAL